MLLSLYNGDFEYWELYHKVTFDGENRLIIVNPGESAIDVKIDIYSSWKEWFSLRDNAKFLPALRTIGGDTTEPGQYAGDTYFCINNWQVVINSFVTVRGILYSDDYPLPYIINPGGGVYNKVSNLALAYNTTGVVVPTVTQIRQEIDTNSSQLAAIKVKTDTITTSPTVIEIADQVRVELTAEIAHLMALQNGLTAGQATMLLEMYNLTGLDPTKPLVVTKTQRTAGAEINQTIAGDSNITVVTRI